MFYLMRMRPLDSLGPWFDAMFLQWFLWFLQKSAVFFAIFAVIFYCPY